jgi:hypothetical protein
MVPSGLKKNLIRPLRIITVLFAAPIAVFYLLIFLIPYTYFTHKKTGLVFGMFLGIIAVLVCVALESVRLGGYRNSDGWMRVA